MPLVSVCIPTYNYAGFIGRAIESLLAQTHEELELIVLDDCSTDDTEQVVAGFDDERLEFRRNERNLGLFANFNRCFEVASGDYVKVLCADDWLHERNLQDCLEALSAAPNAAMATTPAWLADSQERVTGLLRAPFGAGGVVSGRDAIRAHADWGNAAGMPSHVLLRAGIVNAVGNFEVEFAPASDVHLWLKVLARHDLAWVREPRCYVRIHEQHGHGYAYEPNESVFLLWEDMHRREPEAVDAAMLERALEREARHHLLYVSAYLLRGRVKAAGRLLAAVRRHVPLGRALGGFLLRLPRTALEQAGRIYARATRRLVMYDPAPRPGPRRANG